VSAAAGQRCAWPGCQVTAKRGRLMCSRDWIRLPRLLRDLILLHYAPGQTAATCTPEYREALADVLAYARRVNAEAGQAAERQRQAEADQEALW
jgi:hypothetical protein